jgi:hypothetical protein
MNVGGKTEKVGADAPKSAMQEMKSDVKAAGDAMKSEMKAAGDKMKAAVESPKPANADTMKKDKGQ